MKKIVIIGSNGQLGIDICNILRLDNEIAELTHKNIDINNFDDSFKILKLISPDIIINTAAYHNVELCEKYPDLAFNINSLGARNLSLICNDLKCKLVHISTDYVFDGNKSQPYTENDATNPLNVYGNSKLSGEIFIKTICQNYLILRVSGLYGKNKCRAKNGLNFVQKMLELSQKKDIIEITANEFITPTYTLNLAKQIKRLLYLEGLYHCAPLGECSWFDFAKEIFQLKNINISVNPIEAKSNLRPKYSVLDKNFLIKQNLFILPDWKQCLKTYLND